MNWLIAGMLALAAPACMTPPSQSPLSTTAIVDATVLDVRQGALLAHRTVLIERNRITAVGPLAEVTVPAGARVLHAQGAYLIPGLWDMHTHLTSYEPHLRQFIAYGVTGVRDMGSLAFEASQGGVAVLPRQRALDEILRVRQDVASGQQLGPRIVTAGVTLNGPLPPGVDIPFQWLVATPDEATRAVDELASRGVDFIKVHQRLSRDTYDAIVTRAKAHRLPFSGHAPSAVGIERVANAGQASVEHTHGLAEYFKGTTTDRDGSALMALFRAHGTVHVPTLASFQGFVAASASYETPERDPRMKQIRPLVFTLWKQFYPPEMVAQAPTREIALEKTSFTKRLHAAGVPLMTGTDLGGPFVFAGPSLHDEFELLVRAGLSPIAAIRAATLTPAEFLMKRDVGEIGSGKLADMILLDANPLENISNTRRIAAVVADGRLFDREAIAKLLIDESAPH